MATNRLLLKVGLFNPSINTITKNVPEFNHPMTSGNNYSKNCIYCLYYVGTYSSNPDVGFSQSRESSSDLN